MNIIKATNLNNGNSLMIVNVAGTGGGRKWGIWRNVYVVETHGQFTGINRKNVANVHFSKEYDARSNKGTKAAHKLADEVFFRASTII